MARATGTETAPNIFEPESVAVFSEDARRAVYDVIALRRDVRHFRADEVDDATLDRVLGAAHLAPSVGFSQPWGFVVVRDVAIRGRIRNSFLRCREAEAVRFPPERREAYLKHKLEGILETPLNVCVAVDLRPQGEAVLGTTAQPEAVRASACCAVQNLWLAARAEGLGVGWVSIVEPQVLRHELSLPPGVEPVAYLCVGHPVAFRDRPMLEETGWRPRRPVADAIHRHGRWEEREASPPRASDAQSSETSGTSLDSIALGAAKEYEKRLAKPVGSLGRLEEIAAWYAAVRGRFPPPAPRRTVLGLFAADHGVAAEGVSAYGSQVTSQVVVNVMAGGAAINAVVTESGVEVALVDVGIAGDLSAAPTSPVIVLRSEKVRFGSGNLRSEAAMTEAEAERAVRVGAVVAREAAESGADVLCTGEIGIGNTTAAAALISVFTGQPPGDVVGAGTGIDAAVRTHKVRVVEDALALHRPHADRPLEALASVGGLEIAALAGFIVEGARRRLPIVLDGVVTNAAALVAVAMEPTVRPFLLASHASTEPGARAALATLGLEPLFDLGLRLGEGTGAALGAKLLATAVATHHRMATFETAGVVGRSGIRAEKR
jgi:nicotinate-nucleotide--dimethylbenzimidazole phosphoribosyltransferase